MPQVVVRLRGGLGNQLFQYGAGRALARSMGAALRLDAHELDACDKREFALHQFKLAIDTIGRTEVYLRFHAFNPGRGVGGVLARWGLVGRQYTESKDRFDPALGAQRLSVLLNGYWQSHRYLEGVEDELRAELVPSIALPPEAGELLEVLNQPDSVAIHVRRGDYVADKQTYAFHGVCEMDYYHRALKHLEDIGVRGPVVVFSDDPQWVEDYFLAEVEGLSVRPDLGLMDAQEMWLMSRANHQIIANSTFSWWAAWMNTRPGRQVVAPRRWFQDPRRDTRDLLPRDWRRL